MTAHFDNLEDAAAFCAELVRRGIGFDMLPAGTRWLVRMTGAF